QAEFTFHSCLLANWDHQLGLQPIGAGPSPFTNLSTQIKEDSDFHLAPLKKGIGGHIKKKNKKRKIIFLIDKFQLK
ncbi:MAG: hypothetical protein J7L26_12810, partial [Candidatus Aminicenantes bacterium]|nr:hypothetical protein [Candidatus Aminicenantes bacterium]